MSPKNAFAIKPSTIEESEQPMNPVLEKPMGANAGTVHSFGTGHDLPAAPVWTGPASDSKVVTRAVCRAISVACAVTGLVLLALPMAVIALLVKLTSPGPVFYTQTRVGLDRRARHPGLGHSRRKVNYGGRLFKIYKFRTMRADPAASLQVWADRNDQRVTRLGRFLRRSRLDELPQLINVLKGDMNIVGPRPEQPNIFLDLHRQIADYGLRQQVLPGITGWAQINHHYDTSVEDVKRKLVYDLEYIQRRTALTDLLILFRTVPAVILKGGGW